MGRVTARISTSRTTSTKATVRISTTLITSTRDKGVNTTTSLTTSTRDTAITNTSQITSINNLEGTHRINSTSLRRAGRWRVAAVATSTRRPRRARIRRATHATEEETSIQWVDFWGTNEVHFL